MGKTVKDMDVSEKVVVMSQVIGEGIDCLSGYVQHTWNSPSRHENVLRCISKFGRALRELLEVEEVEDFDYVVDLVAQGCSLSETQVTLDRVKAIVDGTYEIPEIIVNPKQLKENGRVTLYHVHDEIAEDMVKVAMLQTSFERDLEGLRILRVCISAYDADDAFLVTRCLDDLGDLISPAAKLSILMGLPQEGGNK